MLLDSLLVNLWPIVLIATGCACVCCYAVGFDDGHSRGHEQARSLYERLLGKVI